MSATPVDPAADPAAGLPADPPRAGPDGVVDLGFARVDTTRAARTGVAEVVLAAGKTPQQVVAVLAALRAATPTRPALATRCDPATLDAVRAAFATETLTTDPAGRTVAVGPLPEAHGEVLLVSAGTSDLPVVEEAALTLAVLGVGCARLADVGVAGLHRVLAVADAIAAASVVVVAAGMDAALVPVVAGLTAAPVVAVPTSVGYGVAAGGSAAAASMLASCAPGVGVVNIDNGFGAAVLAARVLRAAR